MPTELIKLKRRPIALHTATLHPQFTAKHVLCRSPWDYVSLWLRRRGQDEALFFWEQAGEFFEASSHLRPTAAPLTSYYCVLNATKALLMAEGVAFGGKHGVGGTRDRKRKRALSNEMVECYAKGVFGALCQLVGDSVTKGYAFSLRDGFRRLPFIHRAFTLTYKSEGDILLPVRDAVFVRQPGDKMAWFTAVVEGRYVTGNLKRLLPVGYEIDTGGESLVAGQPCRIRRKTRFTWQPESNPGESARRLVQYHKAIRKVVVPIMAPDTKWYLIKDVSSAREACLSELSLIFGCLHRLSELSRYAPLELARHLECQHNWLVMEFLRLAPAQFAARIASEITGEEFIASSATSVPCRDSA